MPPGVDDRDVYSGRREIQLLMAVSGVLLVGGGAVSLATGDDGTFAVVTVAMGVALLVGAGSDLLR